MKYVFPIAALSVLLSALPAGAQTGLSPAAPMDLTRPQFDTQSQQFNTENQAAAAQKAVVAEVDGRPITLGDVGDTIRALPPAISQRPFDVLFLQARGDLIQREALVVLAHQTGVDEDPAVLRQLKAEANRVLADAYLLRAVNARITEAMLLAKYNEVVAGKPGLDEVRFRLILVGTRKEAIAAIAEIQGGKDFADVARRVSKDPTSGVGGEVGFSTLESLQPEIGAVVFALAPGQLAPNPVRAAGAWYVLKTEERRAGETPPFPVVREILRHALQRELVPVVAKEAMAKVSVHTFSIAGKAAETEK